MSAPRKELCVRHSRESPNIPCSSRPDRATPHRAHTDRGEAAQGLEAPRAMPGQQQCPNNSLLQCPVFEHCQKIKGQHKAGQVRTSKE